MDKTVDDLGTARTVIGVGINLLVLGKYSDNVVEAIVFDSTARVMLSAMIAFPVCLIAMAVLIAVTESPHRTTTARQLVYPLRTMGICVAGIAACVAVPRLMSAFDGQAGPLVGLIVLVAVIAFTLAIVPFLIRALFLITKHWFNAVDGHLLLGPTVAVVVTWTVTIINLTTRETTLLPAPIDLTLLLGGCAAITVLAGMEGHRAHQLYGVSFRSGALPQRSHR
ncbi:hypothetical protein H0264_15790 [Nocardia huaxiensis]|uniref:Uncharacterized protein n=1 Tax=Nocardia huaxiensis TaxID=2755382 RepID=A0A7D6VCW4_9NOCA|nr:hypothetical protein [Nocardia huaxiensis]QLY33492.1 hypothetical protein H0264_15790 [Nocardia huaxiensis]